MQKIAITKVLCPETEQLGCKKRTGGEKEEYEETNLKNQAETRSGTALQSIGKKNVLRLL